MSNQIPFTSFQISISTLSLYNYLSLTDDQDNKKGCCVMMKKRVSSGRTGLDYAFLVTVSEAANSDDSPENMPNTPLLVLATMTVAAVAVASAARHNLATFLSKLQPNTLFIYTYLATVPLLKSNWNFSFIAPFLSNSMRLSFVIFLS